MRRRAQQPGGPETDELSAHWPHHRSHRAVRRRAYFTLFTEARHASRAYLRRALGRLADWSDNYRNVFAFASTVHDRVYLLNDRFDLFNIEVIGAEHLHAALAKQPGALLVGAHLGSFEVLRAVGRGQAGLKVAMLMYEENARKINATLEAITGAGLAIIPLAHRFDVDGALFQAGTGWARWPTAIRATHRRLRFPGAGVFARPLHGRHASPAGV
jgi:hypothetical protein